MNPARQTYAKALAELQNRSKTKQQPSKAGGLLQRTSNKMKQDQDKPKEPKGDVLCVRCNALKDRIALLKAEVLQLRTVAALKGSQ